MNQWLFLQINGWAGRHGWLDALMLFCARYLIYVVFAITAAWLWSALRRRAWAATLAFLGNLAVAFGLLQIAAHGFIEQRPFVTLPVTQLLPHVANQSFPSDHATAASAIAIGFMLFTTWRKCGAALLFAAVLIGLARVFCGIHYPGDIAGAVLISAVAGSVVFGAYHWWLMHQAPRAHHDTNRQP